MSQLTAQGVEMMLGTERTKDLYEEVDGYPKPPLVPLPDPHDFSDYEELGLRLGGVSRRVFEAALAVSGFTSFCRGLNGEVEGLLRRCNGRGPILFSPILSATLALADDPRHLGPLARAATLVLAALQLRRDILSAALVPDRHRGDVLEMGQYPNLFSTNVIVDGGKARLFKSSNDSYLVVAVGRRFYKLDVSNIDLESGERHVANSLARIAQRARENRRRNDDPSPGVITCGEHKNQLKAIRRLRKDPANRDSFETMKHTLCTLCLDLDDFPTSHAEAVRIAHSLNTGNRWHHSSMQLVVFGNARACVICNFNAYLDGNTMARAASELWRMGVERPAPSVESGSQAKVAEPEELTWRVDRKTALQVTRDMRSVQDSQQATFRIEDCDWDLFASQGLDPVPVFAVGLQLAMKRLTGRTARFEQFLAMSKYRCMGLVNANVTTPGVNRLVEFVEENGTQSGEAFELLQEAVESQIERCRKRRQTLPLSQLVTLYLNSRTGLRRLWVTVIALVTVVLLRLMGALKGGSEVMLSHPTIYREMPMMGRPGIRLPYVKYFGLHYQILDNSVSLTFMPGPEWSIPNSELVTVLRESLELIRSIVSEHVEVTAGRSSVRVADDK